MKKIIFAIIAIMLFPALANADQDYTYEHKGNQYWIYYPENIEILEYEFLTGKMDESHKYYKLVFLNVLLVKKGLPSIW